MFDLVITMKRGAGQGMTLFRGDALVCAAQIMNLLSEGCTEINIIRK